MSVCIKNCKIYVDYKEFSLMNITWKAQYLSNTILGAYFVPNIFVKYFYFSLQFFMLYDYGV